MAFVNDGVRPCAGSSLMVRIPAPEAGDGSSAGRGTPLRERCGSRAADAARRMGPVAVSGQN